MNRQGRISCGRSLAVLLALAGTLIAPVGLASAEAISHSYATSSDNISKGALLSLVASGSSKVEPADSATNGGNLVGVAADEPLLSLSSGNERSTQVVIEGTTEVLVSDLNGDIRAGDKVTASPLSGIGMKVGDAAEIVGTAQADLSKVKTVVRRVTGQDGRPRDVKVGRLPVAVNVTYYSSGRDDTGLSAFVPSFLQSLANTVAGEPVPPHKVLISFVTLFLGFAIVIVMLQAAIRGGVISIGRNPLAYGKLRRGMIDIIIASIAILVLSAVAAYGLLVI